MSRRGDHARRVFRARGGYARLGACRDRRVGAVGGVGVVDRHRPLPPLTEEIRESARKRPGGWVYAIDPEFDSVGSVPRRGIIGAWRVDGLGRLTGEFRHNPDYVPSAGALHLPPPTDTLDEILHRAAYRQAADTEVVAAVLEAELWLHASDVPGLLSVADDRGGWLIQAYSSQEHAEAAGRAATVEQTPDATGWQRRNGAELAAAWPAGHDLEINPGSAASVRITCEQIRAAAAERA